ncbi:MAG TPA: epimerase [Actinomycetota bacterium]|nr:epimerase [Actinomycetota bacterium]
MDLLVIGGTRFSGRAAVEEAARRGHRVTVFHRGEWEPEGFPEVEHLHGDRTASLEPLAGRSWDAVLDTWAFVPSEVRELADAVGDRIGHYTYVSSLSVHPDDLPVGATEGTPSHPPAAPEIEEVTDETYGPLKVASELQAAESFGGRLLVIRPGYIVGPNDPTDRFTFWVRRAAAGGRMFAPGPADAPFQVIDARDLGTFVIERIEAGDTETYGVVGPPEPATMADVLEAARSVAHADTELVWVDQDFVHDLGDEREAWFPMWHPHLPGFHAYDASKALGAGLAPRSLAETVADTLAWDRDRGSPPLKTGYDEDRERDLLAAWDANPG